MSAAADDKFPEKILLDTHAFLWFDHAPEHLSTNARNTISQASTRYVSIASIWEVQIKHSLGKLKLPKSLRQTVQNQVERNGIKILPITQYHIYALADLPPIHGDPFDRMLIAQAQQENLTLVTADGKIVRYDVETVW